MPIKKTNRAIRYTAVTTVAALLVFAVPVLAHETGDYHSEPLKTTAQIAAEKAKVAAEKRLEGTKLKACQTREKTINKIMNKIADRGQKRLGVYSSISTRVQDFYVKKGKTVNNYEALVADVAAKKAAAQAAIDKAKAKKAAFKCDGTDPKGTAQGFKDELKSENQALHAYQQAIKNLIVAVKSAQKSGV